MSIEIWGKPASRMKAKVFYELLTNIPMSHKELGKDFDREQTPENFPVQEPQIVVNKEKIGGYEAPLSYIENTGYNGTGPF